MHTHTHACAYTDCVFTYAMYMPMYHTQKTVDTTADHQQRLNANYWPVLRSKNSSILLFSSRYSGSCV